MIDSHCHLDHEPLFENISNIIKRSKDTGLQKLLTISTTLASFNKIKNDLLRHCFGCTKTQIPSLS